MKKLFTIILVMCFTVGLMAQTRVLPPKASLLLEVKADHSQQADGISNAQYPGPVKSANLLLSEAEVGETYYDLQTNGSLNTRMFVYPDGTIGTTWSKGMEIAGNFPDRGSGYNYFNGTTWQDWPELRIESQRCGWPTYAPLGTAGEIIISHNAVDAMIILRREVKGEGDWVETSISGPAGNEKVTWPAMATLGPDRTYVHLLGIIRNDYMGQPNALGYWRSLDGAESWDVEYEILDGVGEDYYTEITADNVVWAEPKNETLAFVCASVWHDMFLMKSTDNGDNWDKTIIWEHPYQFYNDETICDTFYCVDYSADITLDNSGMAHVVFGINRVRKDVAGTSFNLYPKVDGIGYWNETMDPFSDDLYALSPYGDGELIEDYNLIGWTQDVNNDGEITFITDPGSPMYYRNMGLSTNPQIMSDEDGVLYVSYSSTTETYDNTIWNYKHVWMRASPDGGYTWGDFLDLNDDIMHIFDECIYAHMSETNNDDGVHMLYNADLDPGLGQNGDHDFQQNREVYINVEKEEIVGTPAYLASKPEFEVQQNYPNPANGLTSVLVQLQRPAEIGLVVKNAIGQAVHSIPARNVNAGTHHFRFDVSRLPTGVYFYSVSIDKQLVSKKMIVE
nr:T9SS type A sorting domain-containing protein [Bacteroidota bacterium]